jgi:DNA repair ATPase RecN
LKEKFSNEIIQLNELVEQQKQELNCLSKQIDEKQNLENLQTRIHNYENAVSQYEEYRLKLENNLQKITQQRDTYKMDLRLTKEMLTNKENEFNQIKLHFEEIEKNLEKQILELNQTIQVLKIFPKFSFVVFFFRKKMLNIMKNFYQLKLKKINLNNVYKKLIVH